MKVPARVAEVDGDPDVLPIEVEDLLLWLSAERGRAPATIAAYRRDLRTYMGWLRGQGRTLADGDTRSLGKNSVFGTALACTT